MRCLMIVCLLLLQSPLYAQNTDDILAIRQIYQETKKTIATLQKEGYSGRFYCDYRERNTYRASWPASGIYNEKIWTYYKAATYADTDDLNKLLVFIDNKTEVSARKDRTEWLFDKGQLIFHYDKGVYDNGIEKRAYFKNNRLIRYMEGKNIVKADPKIGAAILQEAKERQKQFVSTSPIY